MENVVIISRKKVTMEKFASQVKIVTEEPIKKLLSVTASAVILNSDCVNGLCQVNGKVKVNAIFLSTDGKIQHSESSSDFSEKQQINFALDEVFALDDVVISNFSASGNEILCFLEHNISVCGNFKYEMPQAEKIESEFVLDKNDFSALRFVAGAEDNFVVAEEIQSNLLGVTILDASAKAVIFETSCLVDKVVVEGKVLVNLVCLEGEVVTPLSKEIEFKQEIAVAGTLPNMKTECQVLVKNVTVTPEENNEKTNLVFVFDLGARCDVFDEATYSVVTDMFSLKNELQTTYSYLETNNFAGQKNFSDTVMQISDVSSLENFDDIVGVFEPKFIFSSVEKVGEKFFVLGKIESLVIFKSTDDISAFTSYQETKLEISAEEKLNLKNLEVAVSVASFKVKAGKDLEIMFNLVCTAKFETENSQKYVKSFEKKAEKIENFSGIRVYVSAGNENLFDVARNLNVRPELISSQNDVSGIFEQGEKIYVYSPLNLA